MSLLSIHLTVNSVPTDVSVRVYATLLDVLRDTLGLMGTHEGCRTGECGACTILLDGHAVNACLVLAPDADGRAVTTVEGLAESSELNALQRSFVAYGALQCGYCTSGMLMSATACLNQQRENLTDAAVRAVIAGNLCRCTGYTKIVQAILAVNE
jgi:carbon-monoxide dehydrogenase small subunit